MLRAVELRHEESLGRLEDLIGAAQLPDLSTELAQLSGLLARHTRPDPAIDLGLADPLAQRLGTADAQLASDRKFSRRKRFTETSADLAPLRRTQ